MLDTWLIPILLVLPLLLSWEYLIISSYYKLDLGCWNFIRSKLFNVHMNVETNERCVPEVFAAPAVLTLLANTWRVARVGLGNSRSAITQFGLTVVLGAGLILDAPLLSPCLPGRPGCPQMHCMLRLSLTHTNHYLPVLILADLGCQFSVS